MPQKDTLDSAAYTCMLVSYRRLSPEFQFSLSGVTLVDPPVEDEKEGGVHEAVHKGHVESHLVGHRLFGLQSKINSRW